MNHFPCKSQGALRSTFGVVAFSKLIDIATSEKLPPLPVFQIPISSHTQKKKKDHP